MIVSAEYADYDRGFIGDPEERYSLLVDSREESIFCDIDAETELQEVIR